MTRKHHVLQPIAPVLPWLAVRSSILFVPDDERRGIHGADLVVLLQQLAVSLNETGGPDVDEQDDQRVVLLRVGDLLRKSVVNGQRIGDETAGPGDDGGEHTDAPIVRG